MVVFEKPCRDYYNEPEQQLKRAEAKIAELENKNTNLHIAIDKQQLRIKNQRNRIKELEELYAGTKRSKKYQKLKEKYTILKSCCDVLSGRY